jgi:hypothetical protein
MPKAPVHQTTDLQSLEFGAVEPLRNIVSDDAVSRAKNSQHSSAQEFLGWGNPWRLRANPEDRRYCSPDCAAMR